MRTFRLRQWAPGLIAFAFLGMLPELASAQPNALFPDIYIKRQRACPDFENPQYRMMREQFYGVYPTCWRRFPEGWGCNSLDAPDWAAALRKEKLQVPPGFEDEYEETGTGLDDSTRGPRRTESEKPPELELPGDEGSLFQNRSRGADRPPGSIAEPPAPGAPREDDPFKRTPPPGSAAMPAAPGLPPGLQLETTGDAPAPGLMPPALPSAETSALDLPVNPPQRRGLLAQWFGKARRK